MSEVHIYAPAATAKKASAATCPDCKKRTRMLAFFTPWHGWHSTCLRCGREWMDGEWAALEFARGARQRNIDAAKRRWRAMPPKDATYFYAYPLGWQLLGWGEFLMRAPYP